ncbi:hypothetical protein O4215_02485 [Rhodococcus maanshanensis]|nr:hypothetical protein [Rhodococcus maanshanensis]MCZ4554428.1 hypothetical protein [Rhodococcus maanshanensis]
MDPSIWNIEKAEKVLEDGGYGRAGPWWSSTADTGYRSWSAKIEKASSNA